MQCTTLHCSVSTPELMTIPSPRRARRSTPVPGWRSRQGLTPWALHQGSRAASAFTARRPRPSRRRAEGTPAPRTAAPQAGATLAAGSSRAPPAAKAGRARRRAAPPAIQTPAAEPGTQRPAATERAAITRTVIQPVPRMTANEPRGAEAKGSPYHSAPRRQAAAVRVLHQPEPRDGRSTRLGSAGAGSLSRRERFTGLKRPA